MKYSNTTGRAIWELLTDYCYCVESHQKGRKKQEIKRSGKEKNLSTLVMERQQ